MLGQLIWDWGSYAICLGGSLAVGGSVAGLVAVGLSRRFREFCRSQGLVPVEITSSQRESLCQEGLPQGGGELRHSWSGPEGMLLVGDGGSGAWIIWLQGGAFGSSLAVGGNSLSARVLWAQARSPLKVGVVRRLQRRVDLLRSELCPEFPEAPGPM